MPPEESAITIPDSLQSSSDIRRGSAESSSSSLAQMKPSFYRISPSGEDVPTSSKSAARSGVVPRENRSVFTVADDVHVAYETRRPSPPSQLPISELPVEIILHCFSLMPLKSLILSRTVCKSWRHLVPHANLLPNRRRLLELYDTIINSPHFLQSRPWTIDNLTPFDRQAYLDALLAQYTNLPEDFCLWILEWPARAVIRCMWPGLPYVDCKTSNIEREQGVNFLARSSPEVSAVVYKKWTPDVEFIPAFLVWRTFAKSVWLVLHPEGRPNIFGRVFVLDTMFHPNEIPFIHPEDEDKVYCGGHFDDLWVFPDWIAYQHFLWQRWGGGSRPVSQRVHPHADIPVQRTNNDFLDGSYQDIPAPPWNRRHESQFQQRLRRDWSPPAIISGFG